MENRVVKSRLEVSKCWSLRVKREDVGGQPNRLNCPPTSDLDFSEGFQIQDSSFHPFDVVLELAESEITRAA